MSGNDNVRKFQCACCLPPRQIFFRYYGKLTAVYHEDDQTMAIEAEHVD